MTTAVERKVSAPEPAVAGTAAPPALRVKGLRKTFGSTVAVDELWLLVREGEVVGLLGPNGAGKTTTISCIGGLLRPDRGTVEIAGRDSRERGARSQLGVATQGTALYPVLDVAANLRFYAGLSGASPEDAARKIDDAVDLLELGPLLEKKVKQLSIGQQRIVHVASALVGEPRVLLLDEATASLDVGARRLVLRAVRTLAARGTAVLYSSHHMGEVEELCSRVVLMHHGQAIAGGHVPELIRDYGGGRVELVVDGRVIVQEGDDLHAALRSVESVDLVQSARVIKPSLEAVFLALTGDRIDEGGFMRGDRRAPGPEEPAR